MQVESKRIELDWFARTAIRLFAPPEIAESFAGDLLEEANEQLLATRDTRAARSWTWLQILRSIPMFARVRLNHGGETRGRVRVCATAAFIALHLWIVSRTSFDRATAMDIGMLLVNQFGYALVLLFVLRPRTVRNVSIAMYLLPNVRGLIAMCVAWNAARGEELPFDWIDSCPALLLFPFDAWFTWYVINFDSKNEPKKKRDGLAA